MDFALPLIGLLVGVVVGMTGVGAGAVMIPLLLALGFSPITAVGTDLIHAAVSRALGVSLYHRSRAVNFRIVSYLIIGSLVAIATGGFVIVAIRIAYGGGVLDTFISFCIALVLLVAGGSVILSKGKGGSESHPPRSPSRGVLSAIGFLVGLAVNFTSVGAGSVLMPYLLRILKSTREMVGTDLAYGLIVALAAGMLQFSLGNVLLVPLGYLLVGSVPGTFLGVWLNEKMHPTHMRLIISIFVIAAGFAILAMLVLPRVT